MIPDEQYRSILKVLPILCVDLLIVDRGRCLLLKRANDPARGQYWFPGGRVQKMETIAKAAVRKAAEEVNLECRFERIVSVEESMFNSPNTNPGELHTVNVCCLLNPLDLSTLRIDSLHQEFIWVDRNSGDYHPAVRNPLSLIGL